MKIKSICLAIFSVLSYSLAAQQIFDMSKYGIRPDSKKDMSGKMKTALEKIRKQ